MYENKALALCASGPGDLARKLFIEMRGRDSAQVLEATVASAFAISLNLYRI